MDNRVGIDRGSRGRGKRGGAGDSNGEKMETTEMEQKKRNENLSHQHSV